MTGHAFGVRWLVCPIWWSISRVQASITERFDTGGWSLGDTVALSIGTTISWVLFFSAFH